MKVGFRLGRFKSFLFVAMALISATLGLGEARADMVKSWAAIASVADRFSVLSSYNNEAVLDRETGLVWAQKPLALATVQTFWGMAATFCENEGIGGRYGWRLPSMAELSSLLVVSGGGPALPAGHPFVFNYYNIEDNGTLSPIPEGLIPGLIFFTSSTQPQLPNFVYTIHTGPAPLQMILNSRAKDDFTPFNQGGVWCVRGGSGYNGGI